MDNKSLVMRVFLLILLILLIANLFMQVMGNDLTLSFEDMFREIEELPSLNPYEIQMQFPQGITDDWGAFNFFRNFLNNLWSIIEIPLLTSELIINIVLYIFEIIHVLSVGVLG